MVVVEPEFTQTVQSKDPTVSIANLLQLIRKRLWVIVLVVVLVTGGVVGFDLTRPPVYEASILVVVGQQGPSGPVDPGGLQGEVLGLQQVTQSVVEAADTPPVAEAAVRRLRLHTDPETILDNLSATQVHATQFVSVDYRDTDPRRASLVANAVGDALSEKVSKDNLSANNVTATVWHRAEVPEYPVSPSIWRDLLVALILGAMLGVALVFLMEHLNRRWHSPQEVEQISGAPNLGTIPEFAVRKVEESKAMEERVSMARFRREAGLYQKQNAREADDYLRQLVTALDPDSAASEAYRTLRTNLLYAFVDDPPKAIVLTSPGSREGKSTACANLGMVLAQVGKSVLLLDCDLRNPIQHKIFGIRNLYGIVDVLAGERSLLEAWHEPLPGLKVIAAGSLPFDPAELLSSRGFSRLVEEACQKFDYVLIDSPPVELTSDPLILATKVDGVLLIIDAQRTPERALESTVRGLELVGAKLLGTTMNNVGASDSPYSDYGYYT